MASVSADNVIEYVADLNDRDDPYEGEVPERIAQYAEYELRPFPTDELDLESWGYSPSLAAEYATMDPSTMPPIVVEPDGDIIDGFHRAHAALINGHRTIMAYVGVR